ncbi:MULTISPECIES: hypothetical protein [unclassified Streptomyces]|uniref:hypothetical protein n=1 Tax=unclassified Streptomyces TaxID=2593676 RepID=UPI0038080BEB
MSSSRASDTDPRVYLQTPSQAEGEREYDPAERSTMEIHPDVPHTTPSQAEGERVEDDDLPPTAR